MTSNPRRAYERDGTMIIPETIAGIRTHGVTELLVYCECGREGRVSLDRFAPESFVPDAGLRMRCSCGRRPQTRPDWPPGVHTPKS